MNRPHIYYPFLALSILSCAKVSEVQDTTMEIRLVQAPVTKTHLGETDGRYPVYWTSGDRVLVNGVISAPLDLGSDVSVSEATFKVNNVEPPYKVLYPESVYAGMDENGYVLNLPTDQLWTKGSFSEGSDLMWGESADEGAPVTMHHLAGIVRLSLTSADAYAIKSLSVSSLDEIPLSGRFSLKDGNLSPLEGEGIHLVLPEGGVALGSEPVDFHIAIPAGIYPSGLDFTVVCINGKVLHCQWLRPSEGANPGITVKAGSITLFSPMEYQPDAFEIYSAEDWEAFAAACNGGNWEKDWLSRDGTVHIGADFSATSLTPLTSFSGVLDGRGHTITQTAATSPLVKTLTGTIKNLTIAGDNNPADPGKTGACVFTGTLNGGLIENCVNQATITVQKTASAIVAGAFCRTFSGGSIVSCRNEADLTIIADISSADYPVVAGGFVGIVRDLSEVALVKDCQNQGQVTVSFVKPAAKKTRPVNAGYAGIVANVISGDREKYLRIESCTNHGNIDVHYETDPTDCNALLSGAGGILGLSTALSKTGAGFSDSAGTQGSYYLELEDCVNDGTISNQLVENGSSSDIYRIYAGGVVGVLSGYKDDFCPVTSCSNYGKVIPYEGAAYGRASFCSASGGLAGYATYTTFTGCTVKSSQVGTLKRQAYAVSSGVALSNRTFRMSGCRIFANQQLIRTKDYGENSYSLALTLSTKNAQGNTTPSYINLEGTLIENCSFGGSVTYNITPVLYSVKNGFGDMETMDFTASNFSGYICSPSYGGSQVSSVGNIWWNGE